MRNALLAGNASDIDSVPRCRCSNEYEFAIGKASEAIAAGRNAFNVDDFQWRPIIEHEFACFRCTGKPISSRVQVGLRQKNARNGSELSA